MSDTDKAADTIPSDTAVPDEADKHTDQGAPTDAAHQDSGDGSLTGSIPAGLTADELLKLVTSDKPVDGGTG